MQTSKIKSLLKRFLYDYGMVLILFLLIGYYSYATWNKQYPSGVDAAIQVSKIISKEFKPGSNVLVVSQTGEEGKVFIAAAVKDLEDRDMDLVGIIFGQPSELRTELEQIEEKKERVDVIVTTSEVNQWRLMQTIPQQFPSMMDVKIVSPRSYWWPDFLTKSNLLSIADRIVVIAIIAIGMTMVIITAGIDLSVGSLIALSAVLCTLFIRNIAGGTNATAMGMIISCLGASFICGLIGAFSGLMVTTFSIPPFIVTLAMMQVARGLAFIFAEGQSIYEVPASIDWLGRGTSMGIPNTVILMLLLYAGAHILMTRTVLGRYIYAAGGNIEAARLSGVPVRKVILFVYAITGLLAGLGGVVQASQLQSGAPTFGMMYELYVIAAVVVGGTSLSGGQGKILGTLTGAFIIAVIQNGMNLTGVESYTQKVVLGGVILGAVLLDEQKRSGINPFTWIKKQIRRTKVISKSKVPDKDSKEE